MAIGAVILSLLASAGCAAFMYVQAELGLGVAMAFYSMIGTSSLMTLTLMNGLRLGDFR